MNMFCEKCGNKREEGDKFCGKCGTPFVDSDQVNTSQAPDAKVVPNNQYNKIGGWLYLVAIGVFLSPFMHVYGVIDSVSLLNDPDIAPIIQSEVPGLIDLVWFELFVFVGLFFSILYLAFLFAQKKKDFPKYYVWYLVVWIAFLIIDMALLGSISTSNREMQEYLNAFFAEEIGSTIGAVIISVVWITYMKQSRRVAGTFVN